VGHRPLFSELAAVGYDGYLTDESDVTAENDVGLARSEYRTLRRLLAAR
jgi:sugar phosphate isomerase/epimerase